jgi:hypothetical protein
LGFSLEELKNQSGKTSLIKGEVSGHLGLNEERNGKMGESTGDIFLSHSASFRNTGVGTNASAHFKFGLQLGSLADGKIQNRVEEGGGSNSGSGLMYRSGIYNEDFYQRIDFALKNPQRLAELKLNPEEMKEYLEKKHYNELMAKPSDTNIERGLATSSKSGVTAIKDEVVPVDISNKEQNIFQIISVRYAKKFFSGL